MVQMFFLSYCYQEKLLKMLGVALTFLGHLAPVVEKLAQVLQLVQELWLAQELQLVPAEVQ